MSRSTRWIVVGVAVVACLGGVAGPALAQDAPEARPVATVEQLRSAFNATGYQADPALNWDWTSPPVSSFVVHDARRDRVLMVLVYPSVSAAEAARLQAAARDADSGQTGAGPHLVNGFGPSVWTGNVALVQTTQSSLDRDYQLQVDRDTGVRVDPDLVREPSLPTVAVDLDFQQALETSVANL